MMSGAVGTFTVQLQRVGHLGLGQLLVVGFMAFILFGSPLLAFISALLFDNATWRRAGFSVATKLLCLLGCVAFGPLVAAAYFLFVRGKLQEALALNPPVRVRLDDRTW